MEDSLLDADAAGSASTVINSAPAPPKSSLRWVLAAAFALNMFCSHWSRDSLGALEVPLETSTLTNLTVSEYNSLSSAYFLPNVIVPLAAGTVAQCERRQNGAHTFLFFSVLAALGNAVVLCTALLPLVHSTRYVLLLVGRFLTGCSYEALDFLPTGMVAHRFPDHWGKMVGVVNGCNRLGSILNFVVEPLLYRSFGLRIALVVPSAIGMCCLLTGTLMHRADFALARKEARAASANAPPASDEEGDTPPPASYKRDLLCNPGYWLYVAGAACVYGSVVPFWFIGAKTLQSRFGIDLATADAMILLPEGSILVVGPLIGVLSDRWRLGVRALLLSGACSLALIPAALLSLAWLPLPDGSVLPVMVALGLGYAAAQNLLWTALPAMLPRGVLMIGAGVMACSLNLLPALLPVVAFRGHGSTDLTVLAAVGVVGCVALVLAAVCARAGDKSYGS